MKLRDILATHGKRKLIGVPPDKTIRDALELLVKNKIGALLVLENEEKLVGIVTERDVLWKLFKEGEPVLKKRVDEIMTTKVVVGIPNDEIETAETFMTTNRFRHLPVMDGERLAGLISIGDVVKAMVGDLKVKNRYLTDYITGKYPA